MSIDDYKIEPKPMVPLTIEGRSDWETAPEIGVISGGKIEPKSLTDREILQAAGWTFNPSYMARDTGTASTSAGMSPADYPFFGGSTYANRATASFRVTTAGALTATSATITGAITATSGSITGQLDVLSELVIGTGGLIRSGATNFSVGDGYYLDYNAGTPRMRIGTVAAGNLTAGLVWDGANFYWIGANTSLTSAGLFTASNANITGAITASSGSITGPLTMSGASSSISIGSTPPSSATVGTGLWLDRTGLYGLNANTQNFKLDATNGAITAISGAIGGFDIGADYIRDAANSFGMASTVTGGDDVRFWAGDTFANRATADFRVTEAGVLTATSGTVGGWTLGATTLTAGNITLDSTNGIVISPGTGDLVLTWRQAGDATRTAHIYTVRQADPATSYARWGVLNYTTGAEGAGITLNGSGTRSIWLDGSISCSNTISPSTSDVGALGSTTNMWADLFLASGAVINFNNGDMTLTHSASTLTVAGGSFVVGGQVTATTFSSSTATALSANALAGAAGFVQFEKGTAPAGVDEYARLYCDTSGGKERLLVIFGSGAAQVIATEP